MNHFGSGLDLVLAIVTFLSTPWTRAAALAVAALLVLLATARGRQRLLAVVVWLDRLANRVTRGTFNETLSSRAHRMREKGQPWWGWTAGAIDLMFFLQPDHCRKQWALEVSMGWHE